MIERINEIQELCLDIPNPISLPQIVVVGSQSSGKSSILENIVGGDFLPRGQGMVTRRPLMIQIVPGESEEIKCTFGHSPGQVFPLYECRNEIEKETKRILGEKNDVSAIPIVLKVQKKNGVPLTLIDLPGIIKVPAEGQPENIVKKVEEIVKEYLKNKNTIILAVSPSTSDISSSDGLMVAKEFDPNFERTLCVLTKVDLMDPGTDLLSILQEKVVKVKLGFVPVICRGENSKKNETKISEALKVEEIFFSMHTAYRKNKDFCGIPYLVKRLNVLLSECIERSLPALQERIDGAVDRTETELKELGGKVEDERHYVIHQITKVKQKLEQKITGISSPNTRNTSKELIGGARITYSLDVTFSSFIRNLSVFSATESEIEKVIMNASGVFGVSSGFQSIYHFVSLASDLISPHCLSTSEGILNELLSMVEDALSDKEISRFSNLKRAFSRSISACLRKRIDSTQISIKEFLKWNTIYIRDAPIKPNDQYISTEKEESLSLREKIYQHVLKIKEVVIEQVPKIIVYEMVYIFLNEVQEQLIQDIYASQDIHHFFHEEEASVEKRKILVKSLDSLRKAQDLIRKV
ncbi:vacuolar protein sorting-associated protein 1 [Nematocida sp. LUAm3]|nr:vacuolar protein sorting-associated protein 1 [Nematocida sp. LUAm3]KAI5173981.1 vacuolar protein sorting-associated protein 1 [Nematocida sp. LUAm2]KAI5177274.1 vacuolar protein sorting-associated protein 1 [Nematocida sp. LUAm1]